MAEVQPVAGADLQHAPGEPVEELRAPRGQSESLRLLALARVEPRAQRVVDLDRRRRLGREAGTSAATAAIGRARSERACPEYHYVRIDLSSRML